MRTFARIKANGDGLYRGRPPAFFDALSRSGMPRSVHSWQGEVVMVILLVLRVWLSYVRCALHLPSVDCSFSSSGAQTRPRHQATECACLTF